MDLLQTKQRWRSRLPHWEVRDHWHFVTIRCQGSLPLSAQQKIREIHGALKSTPASSEAFDQLQRQYFLTAEKYLDQGFGFAPFNDGECCALLMTLIERIDEDGWTVGEAVILPNHIHLLIKATDRSLSMKQLLKSFKGRSGRVLNL